MKTANPFTLTFGQKPAEFISRGDQINRILDNFDMEVPFNQVLQCKQKSSMFSQSSKTG